MFGRFRVLVGGVYNRSHLEVSANLPWKLADVISPLGD